LMNRYLDPLWNNELQYFFGSSQFELAELIAWKMAMAIGPDPVNAPDVAFADWYFFGLTGSLTATPENPQGNPHLLIYGTYSQNVIQVPNPYYLPNPPPGYPVPVTSPFIQLALVGGPGGKIVPSAYPAEYPPSSGNYVLVAVPPNDLWRYLGLPPGSTSQASLQPGTYWPSGHFAMWSTSISYIFGSNFFDPASTERFAGSAYEAAKGYASATGMTLKLYVPSRFYYPLLNLLPAGVIPDIWPLPDLGEPGYDPNVHPKLYFKAEFYSGSVLIDRWPDSYMIPPQYP